MRRLAFGAVAAFALVCAPVAHVSAQAQGSAVDERQRPITYDFVLRFEGESWEGSLIMFPDSALVFPGTGSCKIMDRIRRRVSAHQESWPCDGPSNLSDFQIIVDRQNNRAVSWKAIAQRPYLKTTNICALTSTDSSGKESCVQYEKISELKATPVNGKIDLIAKPPVRP